MSPESNNKGLENRAKILEKADELIFAKGFHQMSFGDIAKEMGMAKGNLYYYFKSKEAILDGVVINRVEQINTMLKTWEDELPEPKERLKRFVDILTIERDNIVQYGCPIGTLFVELGKADKPLQDNIKDLFLVFINWLSQQFTLLNSDNPTLLAKELVGKTQGVALLANVFADDTFIDHSIVEIKNWVDQI